VNHLVILDPRAGELEKILSGVKTMLLKEFDPAQKGACPVGPGDSLYFLRNKMNAPCAEKQPSCASCSLPIMRMKIFPTLEGNAAQAPINRRPVQLLV